MKTRTKKFKIKLYRLFNIKRCSTVNRKTKREQLKSDPNYIFNNRGISTTYPENWKNTLSRVCSDGSIIKYNPIDNQKATDEALNKLKQETIKGNSI